MSIGRILLDIVRVAVLLVIVRVAVRVGMEGTIEIGLAVFMAVLVAFVAWVTIRIVWNLITGEPLTKGLD